MRGWFTRRSWYELVADARHDAWGELGRERLAELQSWWVRVDGGRSFANLEFSDGVVVVTRWRHALPELQVTVVGVVGCEPPAWLEFYLDGTEPAR